MKNVPLSAVLKVEDGWWRLTSTEKTRYLFVRDGIFYDMEAFLTKGSGSQWTWSLKEIKGLLPNATLESLTPIGREEVSQLEMLEDHHVAPEPPEEPPYCDRCGGYHVGECK